MGDIPEIKLAWVYLATLLAMTHEQCGGDNLKAIEMAQALRNPRGRRKVQAYLRDPDNEERIFSYKRQAAEMLGLSGETRH